MTAAMAEAAPFEPLVRAMRPTGDKIELSLYLPPSLIYFRGHFPGFAILPGVVQVDWAMLLARRHLAMSAGAARAMRVKFARPIRPDSDLTLTLSYDPAGKQLHFDYRDRDHMYGSGCIELESNGI
jgi:3-hydroxymyristoyl/3-hydroxydecanoyl-(acyl carrier protein) dehydratase